MDKTIAISGLSETVQGLRDLGNKRAKSIVRKGLREGGKIIQATERAFAPYRTGKTQRSVAVAGKKRGRPGFISLSVFPRRTPFGSNAKDFYPPYVIFGHKTRGGRGQVEGRDFVGRAFEAKAEQAANVAADYIESQINL